ncbi:DUF4233 domain-containing protein [Cryptosporangium sp. NPDC051539]|uniref:DUF4233 domain-containing protein n=1 Tax=Cryptosporangium sp. NPDC051539 TaxID=3363962 RepID=UPI003794E8AD
MSAPEPPPSGLKNPGAAVRGVGAATLLLEFLVLLLAVQPLRMLLPERAGLATGLALGLAVLCLAAAGLLKHGWVWTGTVALQVLLIVSGLVHWMLAVVGLIFLAVWLYVLNVRKTILRGAR